MGTLSASIELNAFNEGFVSCTKWLIKKTNLTSVEHLDQISGNSNNPLSSAKSLASKGDNFPKLKCYRHLSLKSKFLQIRKKGDTNVPLKRSFEKIQKQGAK